MGNETKNPEVPAPEFDIVLWGASGYTGELVAEYLAKRPHGAELRWAIGGRDQGKLAQVRSKLAALQPRLAELPILVGDSHDGTWLDELASRARVICTTVGPYDRYGSELVAACVRQGTDYCDLAGETHWIRRMIDAHHEAAKASGARIVHCCGYDSIPSDLGCLMLQEHMQQQHGGRCREIRFYAGEAKGGPSGGTIASVLGVFEQMRRSTEVRRILGDPYALNPPGERQGPDGPDDMAVRFDPVLGTWTGAFVMAGINTRVVRRTNALLGYPYGRDFRYQERTSYPKGPRGLGMAVGGLAGLGLFGAGVSVPPVRKLLQRFVLPKPGEGPSREQREQGYFRVRLVGKGRDRDGAERTLRGLVEGTNDPGYGETAKMLAESAILLAEQRPAEPAGGILTPAVALGMDLVERLRAAGMTFAVES
ncbi:MAG: saccharopine dehydrogenase NADP-binding domain-containing protein [Deltaproteobacteria bacterium]|jgi:short subunit dehydrogenase-like uncharacterized protein|nr:saccharopine dehydrogenase NADP-binding domain-containing protein [Deltaproteobacteria bacterium]MBW2530370.1 saccharopine dehydrogenase NADP-binding domain-containing protein [Deltaproteobacteria bacterium]